MLVPGWLYGQTEFEAFIQSVEANNLSLRTLRHETEAKKLEARTGLTPNNPELSYGYLPGNTDQAGTMTRFGVHQELDFPSAYHHRGRVSALRAGMADTGYQLERQELLLHGAVLYQNAVFLRKKTALYREWHDNDSILLHAYEQRLELGDASLIELQKLRLELIQLRSRLRMLCAEQDRLKEQITLMNGGEPFSVRDSMYPVFEKRPVDALIALYRQADPELLIAGQQLSVARREMKLARAEALPGISLGYGYEKTPEVRYAGLEGGISIPLWANRNKVRTAAARIEKEEAHLQERLVSRDSYLREKMTELEALQATMKQMRETFEMVNCSEVMNIALEAGEISLVTYLLEMRFFFQMKAEYLDMEMDYQLIHTELNKLLF